MRNKKVLSIIVTLLVVLILLCMMIQKEGFVALPPGTRGAIPPPAPVFNPRTQQLMTPPPPPPAPVFNPRTQQLVTPPPPPPAPVFNPRTQQWMTPPPPPKQIMTPQTGMPYPPGMPYPQLTDPLQYMQQPNTILNIPGLR